MTEDEAKTKWCPFARQAAVFSRDPPTGTTANRDGREHYGVDNVNCLASACMAWRRQTVMIDRTTNEPAVLGVSKLESLEQRWSDHGYCGLAGAPQ